MAKSRRLGLRVTNLGMLLIGCMLLLSGLSAVAQEASSDSGVSIGFTASKDGSAKDVGLPVYPGARVAQKDSEGDPTAQIALWGGSSGFKLVILKLESGDSPEKIAAFYRGALAKYGKVLDCTGAHPGNHEQHDKKSNELTCDDQHDESGIILKAGTEDKQHIVGIEQKAGTTKVHLVYLAAHGDKKI
jgi:hypothetical protein